MTKLLQAYRTSVFQFLPENVSRETARGITEACCLVGNSTSSEYGDFARTQYACSLSAAYGETTKISRKIVHLMCIFYARKFHCVVLRPNFCIIHI